MASGPRRWANSAMKFTLGDPAGCGREARVCATASSGRSRIRPERPVSVRSCRNVRVAERALARRVQVQLRFIGSLLAGT